MINPHEIGISVIYAGPVVMSILSGVMVGMYWRLADKERKQLYRIMILFIVCIAVNWTSILLYLFAPAFYTRTNILCYITLPLTQVVLYHFIYILTRIPGKRSFNRWHYYTVGVIAAIFGIWSLFVPFDIQYQVVLLRGEPVPGWEVYSRMFTLRVPLKSLYCIVYTLMACKLLLRYRRVVVDYSADTGRSALSWVYWLLGLTVTLTFMPFYGTILGHSKTLTSYVPGLAMISIVIQLVVVCYYTIRGSYAIIENSTGEDTADDNIDASSVEPTSSVSTDRREKNDFERRFEWYMRHKKPYLNSQLRIDDLAAMLSTHRNTLSAFINSTYGMNFSRYINRLRLREMENLARKNEHEKASLTDLALASGFSSYRSYRKFLTSELDAENDRPVVN